MKYISVRRRRPMAISMGSTESASDKKRVTNRTRERISWKRLK
jgi:hypothetical protein